MKAISRALFAALLLSSCAEHPITPSASSFDWLAGCWEMWRDDGSVYQEMWLPATPDGTLGAGREVRNGHTVSYEFQRIELRKDGSAVFFAKPSGQDADSFRMVEHAPGKLAFENPQHDFPTRIEYRYVDLNAIAARISGPQGAERRVVDYPLQRVECR